MPKFRKCEGSLTYFTSGRSQIDVYVIQHSVYVGMIYVTAIIITTIY